MIPTFTTLGKKLFENIVGKRENAGNQHNFSILRHIFNPSWNKFQFLCPIYLLSGNAFNMDLSKILSFDRVLTRQHNFSLF